MHLKSLSLRGFKSFPDRTRLTFAPGVSVVVGPNGSGKSNVTDAVLWAMGEQSPLAVRGASMQDVIFGGGRGRASGQSAEVELVLDDGEGVLGLESAEVSIVRRLDRSGEGEYRLNGARCRLVDVLEVLSDTGLGKESHSVVSQGRVEAMVTSKPRDRRLLIEEAAGLGKHRKRRRRAQLKLARTQENLDRALDVEREARSRLRPLKRQAEAAEIHARLERQSLEASWTLARDRVRELRAATAAAEHAVAAARERRAREESALAAVARRREEAEEKLSRRSELRESLSARTYAARNAGERVGYRRDSVRRLGASLARRAARGRSELDALETTEAGGAAPEEEALAARGALEAELSLLERDRAAELDRELAELEARRAAGEVEAKRLEEGRQTLEAALARAEQEVEAARTARRTAEREGEAARRDAARVGAELATVNQFLRSHVSAPGGAHTLADALEVEDGHELALAAALDGRLGAAVVPDRAAGTALLARAGRDGASALVAAAKPAPAAAASRPPVPGARRLLDLLRGPAPALELAGALLADAWVLDDLAGVPESFGGTVVTPDGQAWFGSWRELRQVPSGGAERVLVERARREKLIAATEEAARAEQLARGRAASAADGLALADAAREEADRSLRARHHATEAAREESRRIAKVIERRRGAPDEGPGAVRRAQLAAEIAAAAREAERAAAARRERAERRERLATALAREGALAPAAARLETTLAHAAEAIASRLEGFEAELAADREAGEHLAGELRAGAREEAELQGRLREAGEAVTSAEVRAQQERDRAAEAAAELSELAGRLELGAEPEPEALGAEERGALEQRVERLARRREQLGPVNPLAGEEYAEALAHVEELERQRGDLESALRELADLVRDTDREIRRTFEETFAAAAANFEEVAGQLFPGGRGRLRLVREDSGPRPVLAGGEAAPEADPDAGPQNDDEGDDADDADDALGVEIEITPAGKAMKRLSLLSGGEKSLTALAFLFAVFLARPCPFYILDEVEAALDDLNIGRFLTILRRYASRAQFIVVTHQKRTMEAADALYGVSMGDDGVSKVISRRLPPEEPRAAEVA